MGPRSPLRQITPSQAHKQSYNRRTWSLYGLHVSQIMASHGFTRGSANALFFIDSSYMGSRWRVRRDSPGSMAEEHHTETTLWLSS